MQFAEIRHDYIWGEAVENGLNHRAGDPLLAAVSIDAWETGDDDEEGRVVANVLLSRHGDIIVDFHDNGVRTVSYTHLDVYKRQCSWYSRSET